MQLANNWKERGGWALEDGSPVTLEEGKHLHLVNLQLVVQIGVILITLALLLCCRVHASGKSVL